MRTKVSTHVERKQNNREIEKNVMKKVLTLILHISSAVRFDEKKERNEEEKEKKELSESRERQKKIFRVYKIPRPRRPPFLRSLWPHCISRTNFFSPREQERAHKNEVAEFSARTHIYSFSRGLVDLTLRVDDDARDVRHGGR